MIWDANVVIMTSMKWSCEFYQRLVPENPIDYKSTLAQCNQAKNITYSKFYKKHISIWHHWATIFLESHMLTMCIKPLLPYVVFRRIIVYFYQNCRPRSSVAFRKNPWISQFFQNQRNYIRVDSHISRSCLFVLNMKEVWRIVVSASLYK